MRLFRPKQRISLSSRVLPFLDRCMTPVSNRFQRWAAPRLTRIERQLSRRQKIMAITVFCLLTGGYATAVLVQAVADHPSRSPDYLAPPSISRPISLPHADSLSSLKRVLRVADSLSHSSPQKK